MNNGQRIREASIAATIDLCKAKAIAQVMPKVDPIEVTLPVTMADVDFTKCIHVEWSEPGEAHGSPFSESHWDVDLSEATYRGELVTFSDSDAERAQRYVRQQRIGQ